MVLSVLTVKAKKIYTEILNNLTSVGIVIINSLADWHNNGRLTCSCSHLLACYVYIRKLEKGISSVQLAKQLGVPKRLLWYMAHRIREAAPSLKK